MMFKALFVGALEDALNRFISLDPDAGCFLRPVAGKVIAIRMEALSWEIFLCPEERGIQLLQEYDGQPDTTLIGSPLAFVGLGLSQSPMKALFSGEVRMEGDVTVGRKFQSFWERLDVDPEEQLSRFTGDVLAHRVGNLVRGGREWTRESLATFSLNLAEFLQEEVRHLPAPVEAEMFFGGVDKLRCDSDRLEARIRRLQRRLDPE